jgi:hypothetical protein
LPGSDRAAPHDRRDRGSDREIDRRRNEGKTRRDAVRALKRHLSDVVYQQLRADAGLRVDPIAPRD